MTDRLHVLSQLLTLESLQLQQQLQDRQQPLLQLRQRMVQLQEELDRNRLRLMQTGPDATPAHGWLLAQAAVNHRLLQSCGEQWQAALRALQQQLLEEQNRLQPMQLELARCQARKEVVQHRARCEKHRQERRRTTAAGQTSVRQEGSHHVP